MLYVGSTDDRVWALDAATGAKLWSYKTGAFVESSPTVVDGALYVGSDNMYAFKLPRDTSGPGSPINR